MLKGRYIYRHLTAAILSFVLILSGLSLQAFALVNVTGTLDLGTKESITFSGEEDKVYQVTIPKKGMYRVDYYNDYHDDYNEDFWVGVYRTQSDAENMTNLIDSMDGTRNYGKPERDYEIYSLEAGTYYLLVQSLKAECPNFGLRVKAATDDDLYELYLDSSCYAGMKNVYVGVGYYDPIKDKTYTGTVTSVTSSNKNVVKVFKDLYYDEKGKKCYSYHLSYKKAGTAKITVNYKRTNGKKATIKKTLKVKKYPNMIKSLKVNGKTVTVSKNKFKYSVNKFKKTSAKIKMTTKNGWKITEATVDYYGKSYKYKELKKSIITKGSSISIPKKYSNAVVYIYMQNKAGNQIAYEVDINR